MAFQGLRQSPPPPTHTFATKDPLTGHHKLHCYHHAVGHKWSTPKSALPRDKGREVPAPNREDARDWKFMVIFHPIKDVLSKHQLSILLVNALPREACLVLTLMAFEWHSNTF